MTQDDEIARSCSSKDIPCFGGSENEVLSRYYETAKAYCVDTVVRLTADCPLVDPAVIDRSIELFENDSLDYVANTVPPETSQFPNGSDVEIFSLQALERANREVTSESDREHVTFYFWKSKQKNSFSSGQLDNDQDWSKYRFTVDYPEDYDVVTRIVESLNKKRNIIKDAIAEEDERNPLTDDEMVLVLMRKNAKIARRTITKYRKELNIPPASKRKRLY